MQAIVTRIFALSAVSLQLFACGISPDSNLNLRQQNLAGLDGFGVSSLDFYFGLPDRKKIEGVDASQLLTSFYYKFEGTGDHCASKQVEEATVPYEDNQYIKFTIDGSCDYKVTLKAGTLANEPTALTDSLVVNFQKDIRPIIQRSCASCHETYTDYATFRSVAAQAVLDVEAGTEPRTGPLPDIDIATFLAWQDAGFPEVDDGPAASVEESKLGEVYYRNNNDDILPAYEMLGRTFFALVRPLWIQPEAQAKGLSTKSIILSQSPEEQE